VASKLLAKVVEVKVKAGQAITRDEILVRLDEATCRHA
jgi:multidrug resistance efflux pump